VNLILFGFKNVGKSHFGRRVATSIGYIFIDTDRLIEELYQSERGEKLSYREIYRQEGSSGFRNLERQAIGRIKHEKDAVIAVGGGAVLDTLNCQLLNSMGTLVYLYADKETISKRSEEETSSSPLFAGQLDVLFDLRKPIYENIPALQINTDLYTEKEVIQKISDIVKQNGQ